MGGFLRLFIQIQISFLNIHIIIFYLEIENVVIVVESLFTLLMHQHTYMIQDPLPFLSTEPTKSNHTLYMIKHD